MVEAGTVIRNRYRILGRLGAGAMKTVYLAEDLQLARRRCALAEVVDSGLVEPSQRQAALRSFARESRTLAQLDDVHIPHLYDAFSDKSHHYLVMEYFEGVTLEVALQRAGGRLAESDVLATACEILDTLDYLHNLKPPIIYGDLKPSNIIITPSNDIKLIDFGIARHLEPQRAATIIGTNGYAPPEQYRGIIEPRSDLYALAAV